MNQQEVLQDLAEKIRGLFDSTKQERENIEKQLQAILQSSLSKLNVVSREEFEAQQKVLQRTREKLDMAEEQIKSMIGQLEEIKKHAQK